MNLSTIINMVKPTNILKSEESQRRTYTEVYHAYKVVKNEQCRYFWNKYVGLGKRRAAQ